MAPSPQPVLPPGAAFIIPVRPGARPAGPDLEVGPSEPDPEPSQPREGAPEAHADGRWVAKPRVRETGPQAQQKTRRRAAAKPWLALLATASFVLVLIALTELLSGSAQNVVDRAMLLKAPERARIADYQRRLLESFDIDYRVVTATATPNLERYGEQAFEQLGVGRASLTGRGLLLLVEPASDQLRLETSTELRSLLGQDFLTDLEQRQMAPFFEQDRVADGILAASELILTRAQQATGGATFDFAAAQTSSPGESSVATAGGSELQPGSTPTATLDAYLAALEARRAGPDLPLYSRATRRMPAPPALTPTQMDQLARTHRACAGRETWIGGSDNARAVIRYGAEQRQCAPWFLVREDGAWRLDLGASRRALAFDDQQHWRLADPDAAGYAFGFTDWRFDDQGVPIVSS